MADTKISALPAAAAPILADEFAINEAGTSKKLTLQQTLDGVDLLANAGALADANKLLVIQSGVATDAALTALVTYLQTKGMPIVTTLGSQYTNATTTGTSVASLKFTVTAAGNYFVRWALLVQSTNTGVSCSFGVNYTGTVTRFSAHTLFPSAGVNAATGTWANAANATTGQIHAYANTITESTTAPNMGPWVGVTNANANHLIFVETMMVVSDTGDIELYAASETGGTQISVEVGSSGMLVRTG